MIKSKFSMVMWWFALTLTMLPLHLFYTLCKVVNDNLSDLTEWTVVVQLVVLILMILFLLIMLEQHSRVYVVHDVKLETKLFFGLFSRSYDYKDLKFAFDTWPQKTALLELPNGRQLTLRKALYSNYDEIVNTLKRRVQIEKLKFKYLNGLTVFVAFAILILFFVLAFQPTKG